MNRLLKSWLFPSKTLAIYCKGCLFSIVFLLSFRSNAQIANYVGNGSFETIISCSASINYAKYWTALDSINGGFSFFATTCSGKVPNYGVGYQFPRTGNNYIAQSTFFCPPPTCTNYNRSYLRNRLKQNLVGGKTYCVKFYVNIANPSTYASDGFGAYFGDSNTLDTIKKFAVPLSYLTPQVQNPVNNIISDTLGWTLITGTFVATGIEKFMVIGNFKSNANTNAVLSNPTHSPAVFTDVCTDDVSCIELDLPAYAGPDKAILIGDSAFIGREPDFAVDSGCVWYQLPNMATPIATISGLWVKPVVTSTYVVRQILDCSPEKWDTVVVYMNLVGNVELGILNDELALFPNPAQDFIELKISKPSLFREFHSFAIYNNLGQLIREEDISFKENKFVVKTDDLSSGAYYIVFSNSRNEKLTKKLIIAK